jgi:cystathionine beta-lyase family protein involved in aluminum resistance
MLSGNIMNISEKTRKLAAEAEGLAAAFFKHIDETALINTERVLTAFHNNRVSDAMFAGTTGYGYDDMGREVLDKVFAEVFGAEASLVRGGFVNGTHAIASALYAACRPGKTLLSVTGAPYDTLLGVIGKTGKHRGSLKDYGTSYKQVDLLRDGSPDYKKITEAAASDNISAAYIQRSRGYTGRSALPVEVIGKIIKTIKQVNPDISVVVDNCYGEFVEDKEPTQYGADLIAGSLIKNPGGGLAPTGGYVAGRSDLVEAAAFRLTAPGLGGEVGPTLGISRQLFQGLFMAPHTVAQAMKTAVFCAALMELLGYPAFPKYNERRYDIIQSIDFNDPDLLKRFCAGIQSGAPVDSFVTPEPWAMPGYDCEVIMAAGAFIQGASIELSCDAPMKPPYRAYLQGGLTYEAGKLGVMKAVDMLVK